MWRTLFSTSSALLRPPERLDRYPEPTPHPGRCRLPPACSGDHAADNNVDGAAKPLDAIDGRPQLSKKVLLAALTSSA